MKNLPESVKIGNVEWHIVQAVLGEDELGRCEPSKASVLVAPNLAPDVEKSVLIHEILHAIWASYGPDQETPVTEELAVETFDNPLVEFIINNNEFIEYIKN